MGGVENFHELFADERFHLVLRNTLAMSIMGLIVGFTVPIIFALLINELRGQLFKRTIQTVSYLPHFVSWVVVAGLVSKMLSTDGGAVNQLLMMLHITDHPIQFMAKPTWFWESSHRQICGRKPAGIPSSILRPWPGLARSCTKRRLWTARGGSAGCGTLRCRESAPPSWYC